MKSKSLLLMLLLAFCAPWAVQAHTLTVCDGTDENDRLPVYGNYTDAYQKSEFVIPATMIGEQMNGTTITGLTFYLSSPASDIWSCTFQVFLKEVPGTNFNNFQGTGYTGGSAATIVYTGALDATGNTMTINFDEGFIYHGSNLLIGIYGIAPNGTYSAATFYGVETSGAGLNDFAATMEDIPTLQNPWDVMNFLPKTTFIYSSDVQTYTVSVIIDPENGGTVTGGGEYEAGAGCLLTAIANEGFTFEYWSLNGVPYSTNISIGFTEINQDFTVTAHFTDAPMPTHTIAVSADPAEGGTVSGGGPFDWGSYCTVNAEANLGYKFIKWTENGLTVSNFAEHTFRVYGDRNLVAHFEVAEIPTYTVTVSANPTQGGTVTGSGTFDQGETCTVTAQANEGFTFSRWTEYGSIVSTEPTYTFPVMSNRTLVAQFTPTQQPTFTITVTVNPEEGGTVSGGGTYEQGSTCTLSAVANSNYTFSHWSEYGLVVSTNPNYAFLVAADRNLEANFQHTDGLGEQVNFAVTLHPNPVDDMLTVEASEEISHLEIFSLTGALVYSQTNCSEKVEIDAASFAPGTYIIRMTTQNTSETRRFIKK